MKNKLKIIVLIITCSFFQGSCQQKNNTNMKMYEWTPTNTAPENYPVYIYKSYFTGADGSLIKTPDKRTIYYGWENIGSVYISGEDIKSLPQKLSASWFSLSEKKYYKIEIDLPIQKIDSLFDKGYVNPRTYNKETFNTISYGIAPGGFIVIWLLGTSNRIEVYSGKGQVVEIDFKEMIPTTSLNQQDFTEMILKEQVDDSVLQEIKVGNIPYQRWEEYRKKYNWKIVLTHQEDFKPEQARVNMLNGEQDVQFFTKNIKRLLENWAAPSSTRIQWRDKDDNLFAAKILFEEKETIKAFEKLFIEDNENITLTAQIGRFNDTIKMILSNNENEIELNKTKIKIYSKTD
ncbi:MAG: DUF2931 family protein [Aequorivita sp.]